MFDDVFRMAVDEFKDIKNEVGKSWEEGRQRGIKERANRAERLKQEAFAKEWKQKVLSGVYPQNYNETHLDYAWRIHDFKEALLLYINVNRLIQSKCNQISLYAFYYDKGLRDELKRVEDSYGFMPIEFLDEIPKLVRRKFVSLVKPELITKEYAGEPDEGMVVDSDKKEGERIYVGSFTSGTRGTLWDFSGKTLDSTHYFYNDSLKLNDALDKCIQEMYDISRKQKEKIEAGETLDKEEDFTEVFTLDR